MTPGLALLASIPSPSSNALHIGPFQLRAYGLMIALGVVAAVWLTGRRLEQQGIGTREDMSAIALFAVPAGVVGSRIYHVITDWKSFRGDWWRAFKIWEGGLGIWGGIAAGTLVAIWVARRRGVAGVPLIDAAAPGLALAQAIGRWGNYFNQELFGKPTTLPWALRVSDAKATAASYPPGTTFHPTFLYESLWNFALCVALLVYDQRRRAAGRAFRPGRLFAMYVGGYTFARFFIERLRVDPAYKLAGLRVNEWVSAVVFALAILWLVTIGRRPEPVPEAVVAADSDESTLDERRPMADDVVLLENRDGIALLTLNRPERLDAWTGELHNRYFERLDECAADPAVLVIVVTGAGRGFCAGADMDMLQGIGAGEADAAGTARTTRAQWHTTTIPKPVIAAINGACAGIGLVQALMADVRFAASGAKFTTAFARRGLIAEHGISWVLPKLVGPAVALDLLMSGRVFLADEAARLGVVNDVIAPEHLIDHTMAYASDMAANCSPASMAVMKRQVWDHYLLPLDDATRSSNELMKVSLKADDFREGVQSFVQKRPPKFAPLSQ